VRCGGSSRGQPRPTTTTAAAAASAASAAAATGPYRDGRPDDPPRRRPWRPSHGPRAHPWRGGGAQRHTGAAAAGPPPPSAASNVPWQCRWGDPAAALAVGGAGLRAIPPAAAAALSAGVPVLAYETHLDGPVAAVAALCDGVVAAHGTAVTAFALGAAVAPRKASRGDFSAPVCALVAEADRVVAADVRGSVSVLAFVPALPSNTTFEDAVAAAAAADARSATKPSAAASAGVNRRSSVAFGGAFVVVARVAAPLPRVTTMAFIDPLTVVVGDKAGSVVVLSVPAVPPHRAPDGIGIVDPATRTAVLPGQPHPATRRAMRGGSEVTGSGSVVIDAAAQLRAAAAVGGGAGSTHGEAVMQAMMLQALAANAKEDDDSRSVMEQPPQQHQEPSAAVAAVRAAAAAARLGVGGVGRGAAAASRRRWAVSAAFEGGMSQGTGRAPGLLTPALCSILATFPDNGRSPVVGVFAVHEKTFVADSRRAEPHGAFSYLPPLVPRFGSRARAAIVALCLDGTVHVLAPFKDAFPQLQVAAEALALVPIASAPIGFPLLARRFGCHGTIGVLPSSLLALGATVPSLREPVAEKMQVSVEEAVDAIQAALVPF